MQNKVWKFEINGNPYTVYFDLSQSNPQHVLKVNDEIHPLPECTKLPKTIEYPFELEGHKLCFVLVGNTFSLALDGVYLDSNKPYTPLSKPTWGWGFAALHGAIFVYALLTLSLTSAMIVGVMGLLFAFVAVTMNINPFYSLPKRLLISLLFLICTAMMVFGFQYADQLSDWANSL